jgi:hypothetical protein
MLSSSRRAGASTKPNKQRAAKVVQAKVRAASAALLASTALGGIQVAHSSNWDFYPRIELGALYNDNYRLAQDGSPDKVQAWGPMLDASLGLRLLTQRSEIALVPRITSNYFPDDTTDDSTNGYLDLKANSKTLKSQYGVTAQYANEEVIFSELLPAGFPGVGLGEIVGTGGGRVSALNRRQLENVAPTLTYDFTPRYHLHLDADYVHVAYDQNLFEQVGFQNYQFQAGLGYDISQRAIFTGSLIGTRYDPVGTPGTNGFGGQGELLFHPTQILQYYLRLGALRSSASVNGGSVDNTSITGGAGVTWTYEITQFVLDALRGVEPSSAGEVENHTEVRFRVIHAFKPRLSGFVGARLLRLRGAVGGAVAIQGDDYVAATTGLSYQLTRNYRLAGEYDYIWQRFEGETHAASNAVTVSIIYQPLSRFEPIPDLNKLPVDIGRPQ